MTTLYSKGSQITCMQFHSLLIKYNHMSDKNFAI